MRITVATIFSCFIVTAQAQFTLISNDLKGSRGGDAAWTDMDSDGDIDILIFGNDIDEVAFTKFFRNDDLTFTEIDVTTFPKVIEGSIDWADYNNDGQRDLALIGWARGSNNSFTVFSRIYKFNGSFQDMNISLYGIARGSIDWGDYNQDGFADLLMVGQDRNSNSITKLYKNSPSGFIEVSLPGVEGVSFGDASWADVDSDGRLDFIVSGSTGVAPNSGPSITQIYRNTGSGFEEGAEFPGVRESSVDWGDADNDGDLDLLLTGLTNQNEPLTELFLNNSGIFSNANVDFPGILEGFAKWGDYDNDGDLDVLIVGNTTAIPSRVFKVYENDDLVFTEIFDAPGVGQSSGGWGDFNNDGYLDIFTNGQEEDFDLIAAVYLNDLGDSNGGRVKNTNAAPSVPILSTVSLNGTTARLSWQASGDDSTPTASISYNIKLYERDNLIISSQSLNSGKLFLVEPGNAGLNTSYEVTGLSDGTYRWTVQAVDNAFMASAFSGEGIFIIGDGESDDDDDEVVGLSENQITESINIYPNPSSDFIKVEYTKGFVLGLYDLAGRKIEIIMRGDYLLLNHLQTGTYILKVKSEKQLRNYRIIKN